MKYTQLYNTTDVKKVREELFKKQQGICALSGVEIPAKQAVLDHDHKTNLVRGVLHRQANAALGKLENLKVRYLSSWYPGTLADFLEDCIMYIEAEHPQEYLHPGFLKRSKIEFNKLNSKQKDYVLLNLGSRKGKNDQERKSIFSDLILNRDLEYATIISMINASKGEI